MSFFEVVANCPWADQDFFQYAEHLVHWSYLHLHDYYVHLEFVACLQNLFETHCGLYQERVHEIESESRYETHYGVHVVGFGLVMSLWDTIWGSVTVESSCSFPLDELILCWSSAWWGTELGTNTCASGRRFDLCSILFWPPSGNLITIGDNWLVSTSILTLTLSSEDSSSERSLRDTDLVFIFLGLMGSGSTSILERELLSEDSSSES